jgi:hypothetical protein
MQQRFAIEPNPLSATSVAEEGFLLTYDFHGLDLHRVEVLVHARGSLRAEIADPGSGRGSVYLPAQSLSGVATVLVQDLSGNSPDLLVKVLSGEAIRAPLPVPAQSHLSRSEISASTPPPFYLAAFLTSEDEGQSWQFNLSSVGVWIAGRGWESGAPPSTLPGAFQQLQARGARVLVSFGGGLFKPGTVVTEHTQDFAQAIAYSFLGGRLPPAADSPFVDWQPVFPDFHFDGLDLDLEQSAGSPGIDPATWVTFARALKNFAPGSLLTGAPQSPYLYNSSVASPFGVPFPDGLDDTCMTPSDPVRGPFLLSLDNVGLFDALFVQFYNQFGADEFPTEEHFPARLCQFGRLVTQAGAATRIFVGIAAEGLGMNGNPPGVYDPVEIARAVKQALASAPGGPNHPWFGGIAGWESPPVTELVERVVQITGGTTALYGYQQGDPGW